MRNSARRLLSAYRASRSGPEGGVAVQDGCTPKPQASTAVQSEVEPASGLSRLYRLDNIQTLLKERSGFVALPLFVFIGIALSLLPCSLPMIPILSALIAGEGAALNRRRG